MKTPFPSPRPVPLHIALLVLVLALPLVAQSPSDLVSEGLRLRESGRLDEAIGLFRRAANQVRTDPRPALLLAETLGWQKRFEEAERGYRDTIARFGESRDARLGLARVELWQGEYAEARRILSSLVRENPGDLDAREELARTWYWSGDFRRAEREFRRVAEQDPSREASRSALSEIRNVSAPSYAFRALHRTDDQPYQLSRAEVELSLFSDPLTRWELTAGAYQMGDPSGSAPFLEAGTEVTFPSARLTVAPTLRILSFPDGETEMLGGIRVSRRIRSTSTVSFVAHRHELLFNREGMDDHPWVTDVYVDYEFAGDGRRVARARAGTSRFFDRNEGVFADAYVLARLYDGGRMGVSLGASAAYRDTDEGRFRPGAPSADPLAPGTWSYRWNAVYDPYWTPHRLEEIRGIASVGSGAASQLRWNVQISAGVARDRAVAFGPDLGSSPLPPVPFEVEFTRTLEPWTVSAWTEIPISPGKSLRFDYEHMSTVYYEADEFRAALVGRF
jgi:tetratricopeptide (TPR) repeat protein